MAIAIVQQASGIFPYATSLAITPTVAVTSGNLLVVTVRGVALVTSITGGGVATWVNSVIATNSGNLTSIWYGYTTGGTAAVVVNVSNHPTGAAVSFAEFSGTITSGTATDGVNTSTGANSAAATTGSITPTAATNVLLVTAFIVSGNPITSTYPATGWTPLLGSANSTAGASALLADYRLVTSATGSYSEVFTGPYAKYAACIAAFKAAGGAPPPTSNSGFFRLF